LGDAVLSRVSKRFPCVSGNGLKGVAQHIAS
jgi:hypothetical protein